MAGTTTFGSKKEIAEAYIKEHDDIHTLNLIEYLNLVTKIIELQIEQERNELIDLATKTFKTQVEYHTGQSIRV